MQYQYEALHSAMPPISTRHRIADTAGCTSCFNAISGTTIHAYQYQPQYQDTRTPVLPQTRYAHAGTSLGVKTRICQYQQRHKRTFRNGKEKRKKESYLAPDTRDFVASEQPGSSIPNVSTGHFVADRHGTTRHQFRTLRRKGVGR
eukprot:3940311-Rhodomonas_salina.10